MKTKIYIVASTNIESTKAFTNPLFAQVYRDELTAKGETVKYKVQSEKVYAPQIFLFDLNVFTRQEADEMTWEDAHELAQVEKGMRHVWQYDTSCGTFAGDFNRGCITPDKYYIRIYTAED